MMLLLFGGTLDLLRPQTSRLQKMGVVGMWFKVKEWLDPLKIKYKRNAILQFILKEQGSIGKISKERPQIRDFKDFSL